MTSYTLYGKRTPFDFETFAFGAFMLSAALTALGPVVHYVCWAGTLSALLYGRVRYGVPLLPDIPDRRSAVSTAFLILFFLWAFFAHLSQAESKDVWFKGASVYLEAVLCVWFAMRTVNTPEKRSKFLSVTAVFNILFAIYLSSSVVFKYEPINGALMNSCAFGEYALLFLPFAFAYSAAKFSDRLISKTVLYIIGLGTVGFSFSLGAWIPAAIQTGILLVWSLKEDGAIRALLPLAAAICILAVAGVLLISNSQRLDLRFERKLAQISRAQDLDAMTSHRSYIWRESIPLIKEHWVTGQGRESFYGRIRKTFSRFGEDGETVYETEIYDNMHNLYLGLLYSSSLPGLLLFTVALLALFSKSVSTAFRGSTEEIKVWGLLCLLLLVGQIAHGIVGDIFEWRRDIGTIFWACWGALLSVRDRFVLRAKF